MSLFKDILSEMRLLNEDASVNDINDAINGMLCVKMTYDDGEGGQGERIICPVAYGISTNSNPVVRAFQKSGPSKSGHKPNWRLFKVSNIQSWENIENQKYVPEELVGLNLDGDKQMSSIYTIAKIGSAKNIEAIKNKGMAKGLKSTPITKKDVNTSTQKQEQEPVNQERYTANNAIDDILKSTGNEDLIAKNLDNNNEKSYSSNIKVDTINAPETEPVKVSDVPGGEKEVSDEPNKGMAKTLSSGPIKKKDLETPEEVSDNFKKMMSRMDNPENTDNEEE